ESAGPYPIPAPEPEPPQPQPEPDVPAGPLSPLVRKMSREYNIDLRQVKGTGAAGRITKQDLESYMSAQGAKTMAQSTQPAPSAAPAAPPQPQAPPAPAPSAPAAAAPQMPRAEMP